MKVPLVTKRAVIVGGVAIVRRTIVPHRREGRGTSDGGAGPGETAETIVVETIEEMIVAGTIAVTIKEMIVAGTIAVTIEEVGIIIINCYFFVYNVMLQYRIYLVKRPSRLNAHGKSSVFVNKRPRMAVVLWVELN